MSTPWPGAGNLSANFHLIVATLLLCCSFAFADKKQPITPTTIFRTFCRTQGPGKGGGPQGTKNGIIRKNSENYTKQNI